MCIRDSLINPSPENSERIFYALNDLSLTGFSANSFAEMGLQVKIKDGFYADLLTPTLDGITYSDVESCSLPAKLFGVPILLASIDTLIKMKEIALFKDEQNSEKHKADIAALRNCS